MQSARDTEAFRRICREHKIAATHQRQMVYQAIQASTDHPTPEWLFDRVREQIPSISLATIYKCLHTFLEAGLIKEASLHHGSVRIDPILRPHHHLVCRVCGLMADLAESDIVAPSGPLNLPAKFRVERTTVEFIGTCGECLEKTQSRRPGKR